jgi:MFS family permease
MNLDSKFDHKRTMPFISTQLYRWLIWGFAAAFFFTEYLARVAPSVMAVQLMRDFSITASDFGMLSGFFYYAYVAMQLPVGSLVDRFKPHLLLGITAMISALGCYIFAISHSFYLAAFGRFLTGFSGAFAFIGALKIATEWFPAHYLGLLAGTTQALGMLGAACGESAVSYAVEYLGWRPTMITTGHALALIGIALLFCRRKPSQAKINDDNTNKQQSNLFTGLSLVLSNPQSWINGLFAGLIFAPTGAFSEVWGPTYLYHVRHIPEHSATLINLVVFLGWALAGPVIGQWSDKLQKRKPFLFFSALGSFITLTALLYWPDLSVQTLLFIAFSYGLFNTGLVCSYAIAAEINPSHASGVSMAFANMASVIIGVIFLPVIGYLLDFQWHGKLDQGIRAYSSIAYEWSMLALPACLLLAMMVSLFVKETACKPYDQNKSKDAA